MTHTHVLPDFAASSSSPEHAPAPLMEEVARRAYPRWTARCQPWDYKLQDWLGAETDLALESAMTGRSSEAAAFLTIADPTTIGPGTPRRST